MIGFNCLMVPEPLRGDSLLSTINSPGVPGTYLIELRRKAESTFESSSGFELVTPWSSNLVHMKTVNLTIFTASLRMMEIQVEKTMQVPLTG